MHVFPYKIHFQMDQEQIVKAYDAIFFLYFRFFSYYYDVILI